MIVAQLIQQLQQFPLTAEVNVGAWCSPITKKIAELDPVLSAHYGRVIIGTEPIDKSELIESLKEDDFKYNAETIPLEQQFAAMEEAITDPDEAVRKANATIPS